MGTKLLITKAYEYEKNKLPCECQISFCQTPLRQIYVIKTILMDYLSSVYFVSQLLHVSGVFVAHHQKVYCLYTTTGMCCAFQLTVCWPVGLQTVN